MDSWFIPATSLAFLLVGLFLHDYIHRPGANALSYVFHGAGFLVLFESLFDWNGWGTFLATLGLSVLNAYQAALRFNDVFMEKRV